MLDDSRRVIVLPFRSAQRDKYTTVTDVALHLATGASDVVLQRRCVDSDTKLPTHLDTHCMEKITGPIDGFYVASYAWPSAAGQRYTSYAKICHHKPRSYWDAQCILKLFGGEDHASAAAALASANLAASETIDDLPPLACSTFGLGMPYFDAVPSAAA